MGDLDVDPVQRALSLLVMSARVSPPLRDAVRVVEDEYRRLTRENERLRNAILDIDAHATGFGEDVDGFVDGGYLISVGSLHRALGVVGHTTRKCLTCPHPHGEQSDETGTAS